MRLKRVTLTFYVLYPDSAEDIGYPMSEQDFAARRCKILSESAAQAIGDGLHEMTDAQLGQIKDDHWDGLYPYNTDDELTVE